jgi:hypothetical protein
MNYLGRRSHPDRYVSTLAYPPDEILSDFHVRLCFKTINARDPNRCAMFPSLLLEPELLHAIVLSGRAAVLEQACLLERLAEQCGQAGAMNWLSHFLGVSSFKGKKPYLVLIVRRGVDVSSLQLEDVHAAVFLFEYRVLGLPTGAFSTDDWAGFRTVVAPEAERGAIAAMAADALLEQGAELVLISYGHAAQAKSEMAPTSSCAARWAWQTRPVAMTLPLEPTLQATLARLGKATRFNLGYYRRRLGAAMPCEFIADARPLIKEQDLESLNAGSLNRIPLRNFRHKYLSSCRLPGGFLLGLRNDQGKWLSLIGGWRQGSVTVLYWQMNAAGYEKLSIGTAMRSYFLEHEVGLGAKTLVYYGGTPHAIGNSFVRAEVTDLVVRRRSWGAAALQQVAQWITSPRFFVRINSLLAQAIGGKDLEWHAADATVLEQEPTAEIEALKRGDGARSPSRP